MKFLTTSAVLFAAMLLAGAGNAGACEWQKQAMAAAATPPAETTVAAPATTIDPVVLAEIEKASDEAK
ncbi:MAG: hypothetical protein ABI399_10385 [Bauldia sp.]